MDSLMSFITNYRIIDWAIGLMGLFGLAVIVDRSKALYFDLAISTDEFMKVVMGLLREDKVEEAITFCGTKAKKPLAYVVKRVLERSECDQKLIEQSMDAAASEIAPKMVKRLGHLAMISNVATLIGLLGTVIGLIMSFKAVSFADPSQKQALLANGISMAMHSTMAGLLVAIPVMVIYSFLHDKQNRLFAEVDRCTNQIMEYFSLRGYEPFTQGKAYPTHLGVAELQNSGKQGPPPATHVS